VEQHTTVTRDAGDVRKIRSTGSVKARGAGNQDFAGADSGLFVTLHNDAPVPVYIEGSLTVTGGNLPADTCAEVDAALGTARFAVSFPTSGHGCQSNETTLTILSQGTLSAGDHDFSVEAHTGEMAGSHAAGTFDVTLRFGDQCTVIGTPGDDPNLTGTGADDVICGLGGVNTIKLAC
jgi:hypothetical protein